MGEVSIRWNLSDLYPAFEDSQFNQDYEDYQGKILELNHWAEEHLNTHGDVAKKIEEYICRTIDLHNIYIRLMAFSYLSKSAEAKNSAAVQALGRLQEKYSNLKKAEVLFLKWLSKIEDLPGVIDTSSMLKEHTYFLNELISQSKYLLSDQEEIVISKLTNTGAVAWANLQSLLTSTLLVEMDVEGEIRSFPLSAIRSMAYEADGELRKRAYEAELKAYRKIVESSAAAMNGIKGETLTISQMRGFGSPLEQTLMNSRMSKETLEAMLKAMEESLPVFQSYYRQKGILLGHKNGLPFYDLFAPMGTINKQYSFEEAINYVVKNFNCFSQSLGDFAREAYEKQWIDVEPREGKSGGAFCYNIHPIKQSRFLLNFTGSFGDVTTLAHELGHGFHGDCLKNESLLNSSYPMPLAETASIFSETILVRDALEKGTKEEQFSILENTISHAGQVIVDIYSRYLFESEVFKRREDHVLTPEELNEMMLDAQIKAYGDGLDHNALHPYMWVNKSHYYSPTRHFYNFPYAFGLLFSKGLFAQYLKEGDTFPRRYEELLRATGKMSIEEVAQIMDIDVTSIDFWRSSLKLVEEDIKTFIELAKEQ